MQLYVTRNGEPAGPFGADDVLEMIRRRELNGNDEVWLEGEPETVPVFRLLGGKDATDADARVLDTVKPKKSSPPRRQNPGECDLWEIVGDLLTFSCWDI